MNDTQFTNKYTKYGKRYVWHYNGGCEYTCDYHRGKVEWHHPISSDATVGMWLCEAHHSLLKNENRKRYLGELGINKTIREMHCELEALEGAAILRAGYKLEDKDKN